MDKYQIPFFFNIRDGVFCQGEDIIYINQEETKILGVFREKLYRDTPVKFLLYKKALFINFRGHQYGSLTLTVEDLLGQFKVCCIAPVHPQRLHANEYDIEFE